MKKTFFIFMFLVLPLTGCSQQQMNITPPDSDSFNDQLKDEFEGEDTSEMLDDFEKQLKDDKETQDTKEILDDFEKQLNDDKEAQDMDEMLDDFENQLKDDKETQDTKEMLDDFESQLKDDKEAQDMDEMLDNFENQLADDLAPTLPETKTEEKTTGGSCDAISKMSTCTDYVGQFWTEQQMKLSCSYSGVFSHKPCESGSIGGCNVGKGSFTEMIIWMYPYGGSPISGDSVESARPACDTNPLGSWENAM